MVLETLLGGSTAAKVLMYLENYGEGYASGIAKTFEIPSVDGAKAAQEVRRRKRAHKSPRRKRSGVYVEFSESNGSPAEGFARQFFQIRSAGRDRSLLPREASATPGEQAAVSRIHRGLTVAELAAIVSEALNSAGIVAVLGGGSVATIYADNQWESRDLDFIVARVDRTRIAKDLAKLGFKEESAGWFSHPDHTHYVNTSTWPIVIGEEEIDEWTTLSTAVGELQILTPTQCVKDRLTGFYHDYDRQSLDQAVAVCMNQDVDLEEVERLSNAEREPEKLKEFLETVRRAKAAQKRRSRSY